MVSELEKGALPQKEVLKLLKIWGCEAAGSPGCGPDPALGRPEVPAGHCLAPPPEQAGEQNLGPDQTGGRKVGEAPGSDYRKN